MAQHDLELDQIDVKTAFLHSYLDEIFKTRPVGFKDEEKDMICTLKKSLYGLRQR